uniref:Uncharacterized protein n=1 Tax=Parascaris equorum TaxID=6256 RepID=A0A914SI57_PAREQ
MAFGWPTRYLKLDVNKVVGGVEAWDRAVRSASDEYNNHVIWWIPEAVVAVAGFLGVPHVAVYNLFCLVEQESSS